MDLVKLGGSVLTDKARRHPRVRTKVLGRLARELATAPGAIVVVHGAGSFGHAQALKAGLARPARADPHDATAVHLSVRRLHAAVLDALDAAGLAPWSCPPGATARATAGRLRPLDRGSITAALERGHVPVLCGDLVLDKVGYAVVSGDTLLLELAKMLGPKRAFFVQAERGLVVRGRVAARAGPSDLRHAGKSRGVDVTGGMRAKLQAAIGIARTGADVRLVPGGPGCLREALAGAPVGTEITP